MFEIGTEELPAAYLPDLIEQLGREAAAALKASHLSAQSIESFGAPRRLVLIVRGLTATQRQPAEDVRGPSKQAAYDAGGQPTPALTGFLRSHGATLAQTKLVSSDKGDYVYLVKPATTTPTAKGLPAVLSQLVGRLRAPKMMRWDASGVRFARPIRWVCALYGTTPIRYDVGRVVSAPQTWVGRPTRVRSIRITSLDGYWRALNAAGVILDQGQRRARIDALVAHIAKQAGGEAASETASHGLLDEVTQLTEQPVALAGSFDSRYLELPREVLLASMAKYQRVFAMEREGQLLPRFAGILEGHPGRPALVREVMERILNARLADSLMFWTDDHRRLPLERMAAGLSGITFHERLGSMAEKTLRLRALSEPLAEAWRLSEEERRHLRRACQLAKADLVSTMVKEFPTLQGVVGKYYARDSGESATVAEAIEEHHLPLGGRTPKTLIGCALAILDKYDTLTSYFGLGIVPTGDQDPFGLRRAAQGIVEIAWTVQRALPLSPLWRARVSLDPFRAMPTKEASAVQPRVQRYLCERLYGFAWPDPAPSTDDVDAVLSSPCDDLFDAMHRIVSLSRLDGHPALLKAAKVIERTRNILKGAALRQPQVDPSRLRDPLEQQLWQVYQTHEPQLTKLMHEQAYTDATTLFGEAFYEPLHRFFDKVLVNTPEEALQQNRLALMRVINALYTERIADLSKLTVLQHGEPTR